MDIDLAKHISDLSDLKIIVRMVVEGYYSGIHRSVYKGFSTEFSEHRQYFPGDDIRYIDWNVYARRDRHYIKEFEAETSVNTVIVLDTSSSMNYIKSGKISKLDYGVILSASLSYLLIKQRDNVGLVTYSSEIEKHIPPGSTNFHLNQIYKTLTGLKPGGDTDTANSLFELGKSLRRRSFVILISDLWDESEDLFRIIKAYREKKNEVVVFQVHDPFEVRPDTSTSVRLRDIERGDTVEYLPRDYLEKYSERYRARREQFYERFGEMGIDFATFSTDTFPAIPLTYFFKRRERLG